MARYPDNQVQSEEPAPTKPKSLGLANCQQAQLAKDVNPLLRVRTSTRRSQVHPMFQINHLRK